MMTPSEIDELTEGRGLSREEAVDVLKKRAEYLVDLDNLKPQTHRWVDRGLIMSCEGAGHPYHQTSKRR